MNPDRVRGLDRDDALKLRKLLDTLKHYEPKNREKDKYYEGKVTLGDVNLGIALPEGKSTEKMQKAPDPFGSGAFLRPGPKRRAPRPHFAPGLPSMRNMFFL